MATNRSSSLSNRKSTSTRTRRRPAVSQAGASRASVRAIGSTRSGARAGARTSARTTSVRGVTGRIGAGRISAGRLGTSRVMNTASHGRSASALSSTPSRGRTRAVAARTTRSAAPSGKRGFAAMPAQKRKAIAARGGRARRAA